MLGHQTQELTCHHSGGQHGMSLIRDPGPGRPLAKSATDLTWPGPFLLAGHRPLCLEIRNRRPWVTHHACHWLGMSWDLDSGQEIRARVFPRRRAANRKPPAAATASAECPHPLTHRRHARCSIATRLLLRTEYSTIQLGGVTTPSPSVL
jgi:hypothetical protein